MTLCVLLQPACGRSGSFGIRQSSSNWTTSAEHPIPGVHEASVNIIELMDGSPTTTKFAIWSDLPQGSGGGGGSAQGAYYKATHSASDGRKVEIDCRVDSGQPAKLTINDREFTLTPDSGRLFLISTQGESLVVEQLNYDLSKLPDGRKLSEFAQQDETIQSFFARHATQPSSE